MARVWRLARWDEEDDGEELVDTQGTGVHRIVAPAVHETAPSLDRTTIPAPRYAPRCERCEGDLEPCDALHAYELVLGGALRLSDPGRHMRGLEQLSLRARSTARGTAPEAPDDAPVRDARPPAIPDDRVTVLAPRLRVETRPRGAAERTRRRGGS